MATDWAAVQRALWAAVQAHDARLGETAADYAAAIAEAVRAGGVTLDAAGAQFVSDYLDAAEALIREGIAAAVQPVAATVPAELRSAVIAARTAEAYAQRWPDGLTLSKRVWAWQEETRAGVSAAVQAGVRTGAAADAVVMDMQRAIEAAAGERFTIAQQAREDWADRLRQAARGSIKTPGAMEHWVKTVKEAEEHVASLSVGGTRRQAEHALASIRKAVAAGRLDLVDKHLEWWLYDRQLYGLRRIARTEMSTAHHQAVIAVTEADPDVLGYRWRLSASHLVADICDYYAEVDFGMGAGVWPKEQVPKHKAHPHCMCALTPTTRPMRKDGVRGATDFGTFADQAPASMRKVVVPAWAEQARAQGVPWAELLRPDGIGLKTRAQWAGRAPPTAAGSILTEAPSAFAIAKSGGRNEGLYRRFKDSRIPELEKSIRSYEKRIAEHEAKIKNPDAHLRPECTTRHQADLVNRYWPEEIADFREQITVMRGIIAERTNGNG